MKQLSLYVAGNKKKLEKNLLAAALFVIVIMSALAVIYSTYKSRQLLSELQQAHRSEIFLEERWGRLLLEQSTWASHVRVEEVAISKLGMKVPDSSDIRVVK